MPRGFVLIIDSDFLWYEMEKSIIINLKFRQSHLVNLNSFSAVYEAKGKSDYYSKNNHA